MQSVAILIVTLAENSSRIFLFSMTTIADLNDKWAAYAGPGGWNGNHVIFTKRFTFRRGHLCSRI